MAINFVSYAAAEAESLTMPSHQAGDCILVVASRTGAVVPTIPSGWLPLGFRTLTGFRSYAFAVKIANSSAETSGTWSTAELLQLVVYRDASLLFPRRFSEANAANTTTVTFPALSEVAPNFGVTANTRVIGFFACNSIAVDPSVAPSGMTCVGSFTGASRSGGVFETGLISSFAAATYTASQSISNQHVITTNLVDTGYLIGSGSAPRPRIVSPYLAGSA